MPDPVARFGAEVWVGRDREMREVLAAVRSVVAGRGTAVLIEGEPGIGKSALAGAGLVAAAAAGCQVFHTTADELTARFPLQVLADVLGVRGLLDAASAAGQGGSGSPTTDSGAWLTQAADRQPGVVSMPAPWVFGDPVFELAERILARVDELAVAAPMVLTVDDLHWADEATLVLWSRLVLAADQMALLLVGTCRPVPRRPEIEQLRHTVTARQGLVINLQPLPEAEAVDLAGRLAGAPAGPALRRMVAAAGGNPLYVRETVDALARDGAIELSDGVAELGDTTTPATMSLAGAIAGRLEFLSSPTRQVLRLASLLGPEFMVGDLAAVAGRSPSTLMPVIDEALAGGVLMAADERLRFRHGLIRDCLYESIPRPVRSALHRQAAESLAEAGLPLERVAAQLLLAPADADVWTTTWLTDHGDALAARLPGAAETLLSRIAERPLPDESHRDALEFSLATAAFQHGSDALLERVGRRILDSETDPDRTCAVSWMLGYSLIRTGQFDEALKIIDSGGSESSATASWSARLASLGAVALFVAGRYGEAGEAAGSALMDGRAHSDRTSVAYALHVMAGVTMVMHHDVVRAAALIDEALAEIGDDPQLYDLKFILHANRLSWATNAADADAAIVSMRALAHRVSRSWALLAVATATFYYDAGRWDDALTELEAFAAFPDSQPSSAFHLQRHALSALIAVRLDRRDDARFHLAEASTQPAAATGLNTYRLLLAEVLTAERAGDPQGALDLLAPRLARNDPADVDTRHWWLPALVRLAMTIGDRGLAERAVHTAGLDATGMGGSRDAAARWCTALLDGDVAGLDACADDYRVGGWRPALANVVEDAAVASAAASDVTGARRRAAEATDVYTELGATWELARADARLRALGVRRHHRSRPRRPATGWDALTTTELRVADLVAEGRSNPDIAAVLFLSRRTVQTHVTHILAKLDMRSRMEIALDRRRLKATTSLDAP